MAAPPYKLSCALYGHNSDVRCVAVTHDGKIVSGSRDMTAKVWVPNEAQTGYRELITLSSHNNFVTCVCVLDPNSKFPDGLIITGSHDQAIRLYTEASASPLQTLKSHSNAVCRIVPGIEENTIVSSSWDKTAKLWDLVTCKVISTYSGHEAAIWSALQLPDGVVVTGSADKKIKIWIKNGSCLRTLSGHKDCVRDLAIASNKEILSCANDATVKLWNVETGECLNTFYGHGNYIYTIATIGFGVGGFLTGSEDRTIKLWINGEVAETITIPAVSVWSVCALPNGDIVAGSNDGVVRVFSAEPARQASPEQLKAYEAEVAAAAESGMEYGGFKLSELPGLEALYEPGKKDGQTKIIKENNTAVAYGWSAAEGQWNKIGEVMGSASDGVNETGKTVYNGKEYDYVFSVDIEEGKPPLKLPYNKSEDPWLAAQKFIHDNNLSQYYLEQVANFIINNSSSAVSQSTPPADFVDPFTGSARYIPQTGSQVANGLGVANSDPFTGGSRYKPNSEIVNTSTYFPQREFLRFDQANLTQILEKLIEFNKKTGDGSQVMSESSLEELIKICEPGASCNLDDISKIDRLLEWPQEIVFPVLDVMRLAIRNYEANRYLCSDKLIPDLMRFLTPGVSIPPNNMLALRVLSNMLAAEPGQILASRNKLKLLNIIQDIPPPYTKALQVAMATLLLNISVILRLSETPEGRAEALAVTKKILPILTDQEALFRALVALGTLLFDSLDRNLYSATFKPFLVKYSCDSSFGVKIQECSQHIINILQ